MRKNKTSTLSQRKEQSREAALLKDARRKVEGFYFCPPGGLIRQSFGDAFKIKSTTKKKSITAKTDMFFSCCFSCHKGAMDGICCNFFCHLEHTKLL